MLRRIAKSMGCLVLASGLALASEAAYSSAKPQVLGSLSASDLSVRAYSDGTYSISAGAGRGPVIHSDVEAAVDGGMLRSTAYPRHTVAQSDGADELGPVSILTVTHSGLAGQPDLVCALRLRRDQPWGDIAVTVRNSTDRSVDVRLIRSIHSTQGSVVDLGAAAYMDRILSDSFSEDRPQLAIRDLGDGPKGMHRATGSQLIYNRQTGQSVFFGALTSDRFVTMFHLRETGRGSHARIASYDVEATGTTEILREESLRDSPATDQMDLNLRVNPSESIASEPLMFALGTDYHAQLERYGQTIRRLHRARVDVPTPMGWWSWTAYYFGPSETTAQTNADWLAQNLKSLGYTYFQIDEGYQYARGEYMTADGSVFPRGVAHIGDVVRHDGLTFGLWTAPFEVSERAWVYEHHRDWLVHNAAGEPIHIGYVTDKQDRLYALDTTNPGAQDYLRQTYAALRDWGVRFIKMDFMDDTAVEGQYFRPNTTAMEAQRIGLQIIRSAVGESVVLDKDGSPMLNPVGIVDAGRISQDTGHTFEATRDAASGVAARYYMNRNFFVADPDAFTVSSQTVDDQSWHGGQRPLTMDEARMSIALSAVSGGMFEIGDDLPTLGSSPERLALVRNADLLDMARLGRASIPIDLMSYATADLQPSLFLLRENARQAMLTVFNWTEQPFVRTIRLSDLGLKSAGGYRLVDALGDQNCCHESAGVMTLEQRPHSVRMIKLIDESLPVVAPSLEVQSPGHAGAGEPVTFSVATAADAVPVLAYHWDFGDGTGADGREVSHAYTHSGAYEIVVSARGVDASASKRQSLAISGEITTRFEPSRNRRADH